MLHDELSAFRNFLANGGKAEKKYDEDLNLYKNTNKAGDVWYTYQETPDSEEVTLTPLATIGDDPTYWTWTDASGKIYNPRNNNHQNGSIQKEVRGPLEQAVDNYLGELKYQANNNIPIDGKYTMPAIAANALLPIAGEAAYTVGATPYINTALSAGFAGHGINHAVNEGIQDYEDAAITALEIAPLGKVAKPVYKGIIEPGMKLFNSPLTGNWTQIGSKEYRLAPGYAGSNFMKLENRVPINLSEAQIKNGWVIDEDGFAINPSKPTLLGKRFTRNAEGRLVSVDSYMQEQNAKQLNKKNILDPIEAKKDTQKKAFKIYDELDDMEIKDLREENWFQGRYGKGPDSVTSEDIDIWRSHIPEYKKLAKKYIKDGSLYQKDGKWFGKFDDGDLQVNPAEYIVAHSDAFQKSGYYYDGINRMRAMPIEEYTELVKNGGLGRTKWTTDDVPQVSVFAGEGRRKGGKTIQTIVGNVEKKNWQHRPTEHAREAHELLSGVEFSPNVEYKGTIGNYTNFGHDVPIKSIRGNNGNFSGKGLFNTIIPPAMGWGLYNNLEE